jgi:hypothetical protein
MKELGLTVPIFSRLSALTLTSLWTTTAVAQPKASTPVATSMDGHPCPGNVHGGAYDKPGFDVLKALSAYSDLEGDLIAYHVRDRVIAVGIDLSKSPATLDLVADNGADVSFIESKVPKTFEDVPTEVTVSKPYDRFFT